jgi:hypothetical protein
MFLSVPENQDIYFDIPDLFNTSDASRHSYLRLLFSILDTYSFDNWTPELKVNYIQGKIFDLVTAFRNFYQDYQAYNALPDSDKVLNEVINSIKNHSKQIVNNRLDKTNPHVQFILNTIERIDLLQLKDIPIKDKPEIVSYDVGEVFKAFVDVRGFIKNEVPKQTEDNDSMKKVLLMIELGLIDYLQEKYKANKSNTNRLLSALSGVNPDLIKRYINGYKTGLLDKKVKNHNNPATPENINWINNLLNQNKLDKKS